MRSECFNQSLRPALHADEGGIAKGLGAKVIIVPLIVINTLIIVYALVLG